MSNEETYNKILLVDDEQNILNSLKRVLIPKGYQVEVALSAKIGLKILEQGSFDLIISDMRMPEMSGAEFLKITSEKYPDTRRILLTGFSDLDSAVLAVNEGKIDYYLSKPWNEEQLLAAIEQSIQIRKLKKENESLTIRLAKANRRLSHTNDDLEKAVEERTEELQKSLQQIKDFQKSTVKVFMNVFQLVEGENKGLSEDVANLAKLIAEEMKLSEEEIESIYLASLLYGIGKVGLPSELLYKPYLGFGSKQKELYHQYPTYGELILGNYQLLKEESAIIASHREYFNGSGYPEKLQGSAIPMGAKILCCALDFYLLQRGLLLKEEMSEKDALSYIKQKDRINYDSRVVKALGMVVQSMAHEVILPHEKVMMSTELEDGMVLTRNLKTPAGMLLIPKDMPLSGAQISKINLITEMKVYVLDA